MDELALKCKRVINEKRKKSTEIYAVLLWVKMVGSHNFLNIVLFVTSLLKFNLFGQIGTPLHTSCILCYMAEIHVF